MKASINCIKLLEVSESFVPSPYLCPAGVPTIGIGSTRYEDGTPVKLSDPPITYNRAIEMVYATLAKEYEPAVNRYVQVTINQNQFDALVDFAYNEGAQNLRTSTLLAKLNAGDYLGASKEFGKWVYDHDPKTGKAKKENGLVTRREAERVLFLS